MPFSTFRYCVPNTVSQVLLRLCGDATTPQDLSKVMGSGQADLLWTDPPYGVSYVGKTPEGLTLAGVFSSSRTSLNTCSSWLEKSLSACSASSMEMSPRPISDSV